MVGQGRARKVLAQCNVERDRFSKTRDSSPTFWSADMLRSCRVGYIEVGKLGANWFVKPDAIDGKRCENRFNVPLHLKPSEANCKFSAEKARGVRPRRRIIL